MNDFLKKSLGNKQLRVTWYDDAVLTGENQWAHLRQTAGLPPFIVVAFESRMQLTTIREKLSAATPVPVPSGKESLNEFGGEPQPPIDAVCVLWATSNT